MKQVNTPIFIEVTKRKCSPTLQKKVSIGARYKLVSYDKTKDGTKVAVVERKGETMRLNASRFEWTEISFNSLVDSLKQREKKQMEEVVKETTNRLWNNLSNEEMFRVVYIPLFCYRLSWHFAEKAVKQAAKEKVEILRKAAKAYRHVKELYEDNLKSELDWEHRQRIIKDVEGFIQAYQMDFIQMRFSVAGEFLRAMPDYPHQELRYDAIMSMLFIRFADKYNKEMDELLQSKDCRTRESHRPIIIDKLHYVMDAYAGDIDGKFNYNNELVSRSLKVMYNRIREYLIVDKNHIIQR